MTVAAAFSRKVILGAGWANPLTHAFLAEDASHVKVFADDDQLVFGVDYVVNNVGNPAGYSVTITTPGDWAPTYWSLIVDTPTDQPSDVDQGSQFGLRYENALDALARRLQVVSTRMTRALLLPQWTDPSAPPVIVERAAGEVLGWSADGLRLEGKGTFDTSVLLDYLNDAEQAADDAEAALADAVALFGSTATQIATISGNLAFLNTLPAIAAGVSNDALAVANNKTAVQGYLVTATQAADDASESAAAAHNFLDSMLAGFAEFDERYQGAFASPPATRTGGGALQAGDLYFDTNSELMQIWTGVSWTNSSGNPDAVLASNAGSEYIPSASTFRLNLDLLNTAQVQAIADAAPKAQLNAVAKDPPVDADRIYIGDSAATFTPKYNTLTQFKAFLKTYFDTIYPLRTTLTTRGDLYRRGASAIERLPVGSAEQSVYFNGTDAVFGWPVDNLLLKASDETTNVIAGTLKASLPMPYAGTFVDVWAALATAQTAGSIFTVDVNKNGTTILSTKITIDNNELTSLTAAIARVLSVTTFAKGDLVSIDVDQVGTAGAKGLTVILQTRRTS